MIGVNTLAIDQEIIIEIDKEVILTLIIHHQIQELMLLEEEGMIIGRLLILIHQYHGGIMLIQLNQAINNLLINRHSSNNLLKQSNLLHLQLRLNIIN